jgi:hypothetical protein
MVAILPVAMQQQDSDTETYGRAILNITASIND